MTTSALGSALSGLRVTQKALDVTAANIANASTEGYTKKITSQESLTVDGVGIGVRFNEVQRYVDEAVQRDYRTQLGTQSYYSVRENYLSRIMAFHGSTDQENNIPAQMGALYDSFVSLSGTPESAASQNSVINGAKTLARSFNNYSQKLLATRNEIQSALKAEVQEMNNSLTTVADLNRKIQGLQNANRSTADLEDQRDEAVKKIAQQIDITYYKDGTGVLVLQTKNGQVMADTNARPVSFQDTALQYSSTYPTDVNGVIVNEGKDSSFDFASSPAGGKIGALLNLRDNEIPTYQAQIDELAHKMMTRLDEQGVRLFTNENGVVPANTARAYVGLAATMQVNDAVIANPALLQKGTSGPAPGAGSNAKIMDVINYAFGRYKDAAGTPNVAFNATQLGTSGNIGFHILGDESAGLQQFSTAMLDSQAADYNMVKSTLSTENQYTQEVQNRLLDNSAVNTDEEMGRMIVLQKSYAASAKMIGALDELFRDLLNAI